MERTATSLSALPDADFVASSLGRNGRQRPNQLGIKLGSDDSVKFKANIYQHII